MNPYTAYLFFRRTFRAFKVLFLLVRRRDLVQQLPGGYLSDLAKTNRWIQLQFVGLFGLVLIPISALLPTVAAGRVILVGMLLAFVGMMANFTRKVVHRVAG